MGHWRIDLKDVELDTIAHRRTWDAIDTILGGSSGQIAVPAWALDTAPYASGAEESDILVSHSDGTPFSDGSLYEQSPISIVSSGTTVIGATEISMTIINGFADLSGVRFSYNHALYKTGQVTSISGDTWTVRVSPSIRAQIPTGSDLEFHRPTCLCNLLEDTGMRRAANSQRFERRTVSFVEDTKYWSDMAAS